jgi:hypothetical protein
MMIYHQMVKEDLRSGGAVADVRSLLAAAGFIQFFAYFAI